MVRPADVDGNWQVMAMYFSYRCISRNPFCQMAEVEYHNSSEFPRNLRNWKTIVDARTAVAGEYSWKARLGIEGDFNFAAIGLITLITAAKIVFTAVAAEYIVMVMKKPPFV